MMYKSVQHVYIMWMKPLIVYISYIFGSVCYIDFIYHINFHSQCTITEIDSLIFCNMARVNLIACTL